MRFATLPSCDGGNTRRVYICSLVQMILSLGSVIFWRTYFRFRLFVLVFLGFGMPFDPSAWVNKVAVAFLMQQVDPMCCTPMLAHYYLSDSKRLREQMVSLSMFAIGSSYPLVAAVFTVRSGWVFGRVLNVSAHCPGSTDLAAPAQGIDMQVNFCQGCRQVVHSFIWNSTEWRIKEKQEPSHSPVTSSG